MRFPQKTLLLYCFIPLLLVFADQVLKWWVVRYHPSLVLANRGVVFGWIENPYIGYSLLVIGLLVLIWLIFRHHLLHVTCYMSLSLITAGAISNLIDRLWRGYIIDYIHFFNLNVFNLADVFIIVGIFLYVFSVLRKNKPPIH